MDQNRSMFVCFRIFPCVLLDNKLIRFRLGFSSHSFCLRPIVIEGQRGQGRSRAESLVRKRFASCVIRDDHMAGRPRQMGPLWRGTAHPGTFRPARSGGYPGSHRRRKHHQRRHKGQCHRLPPGCDPRKRPGTPSMPTSFIVRKLRLTYNCSFLSQHSMPFQLSAALFQPLPGAHCE